MPALYRREQRVHSRDELVVAQGLPSFRGLVDYGAAYLAHVFSYDVDIVR